MKNNIQVDMLKDNDILDFKTKSHETRYDKFIENIPNGSKVEVFVSITTDKGTNAQLARVHVMIRELASTLGYTFEEMKLLVKRRAGLCVVKNGTESCKSFADCDREDLNLVIQALIELGDSLDTNLR
mgnify:CR=1 FL=1|tara:strand:+ start:13599 stop:13982 length:384 start_codon:yes stop_codon:yes gene_type:complete